MRRSKGEWERIVDRYRASGQSARGFSAEAGIGEQSLRNWARKLGKRDGQRRAKANGFVEIGKGAGPREESAFTVSRGFVIRFQGGLSIEVEPGTDRELLGWLLELLGVAS
jgi:transposase-like protein